MKILKIMAVSTTVLFLLVLAGMLAAHTPALSALGNAFLSAVAVSFYICGVLEFIRHRKEGRLKRRQMLKLIVAASIGVWLLLLAFFAIILTYNLEGIEIEVSIGTLGATEIVAIIIAMLFTSVLTIFLSAILAFGAVGVVSGLTRILTPGLLARIRDISGRKQRGWMDTGIAWTFGIPDMIDTRTLTLGPEPAPDVFPKRMFMSAVLWEIGLGVILAIYVAFNPLLETGSPESVLRMFAILGGLVVFVPLVMLPWFVYTGVNATIKGMTKDFRLYDGIKARIFRSYIALGTLVVFVRISLSRAEISVYATWFLEYLVTLVAAAVLFTFVYYNYFDRDLTKDIIERYDRLVR